MKSAKPASKNFSPLLCWDIFIEGYHRRIDLADDLKILKKLVSKDDWSILPVSLESILLWQNKIIVITDAEINIIHATKNIFAMNGYSQQEVIGQSPKMFQGEATTLEERKILKIAVDNQKPFETIVTNHKKDGTIYKCHIEGYPIFNEKGNLVNFVAFENAA